MNGSINICRKYVIISDEFPSCLQGGTPKFVTYSVYTAIIHCDNFGGPPCIENLSYLQMLGQLGKRRIVIKKE